MSKLLLRTFIHFTQKWNFQKNPKPSTRQSRSKKKCQLSCKTFRYRENKHFIIQKSSKKKIPQNDSLFANPGNVDCRRKSSVEEEGRAWTRKRPHCAASGILYRSTFVNARMTEGLARRETCGEDEGCGRGARGGGEGRIGNSNTGAIKLNNEECCRSKYEHGYDLRPRKPVHNE